MPLLNLKNSRFFTFSALNASFLSTQGKKHRKLRFSMLFRCKNAENDVSQNAGQLLTHTVTHGPVKIYAQNCLQAPAE